MLVAFLVFSVLFTGCGLNKLQAVNPIDIFETKEGFNFTEADVKVMSYQRKHKSINGKYLRANYIHPLYGLDGEILTEDFPSDHPHHRGIFWAWHQVLLGDKRLGDPWATQDFFWDVYNAKILNVDSKSRALQVHVNWKSPFWADADRKKKAFIKETTTIRVHRVQNNNRKIDFEIKLHALADDIRLGGSEDAKGYGGLKFELQPVWNRFYNKNTIA